MACLQLLVSFACNSWYRSHYSELDGLDRSYINKIKTDFTRRNHLFRKFEDYLLGSDEKRKINFKTNLELLSFSLNRINIKPDKINYKLSFEYFLIDYAQKDNESSYINVLGSPKLTKNDTLSKKDVDEFIKLDSKYIISDTQKVFAGLFELIYQVRCMVIHGHVQPEKDEHEVIKYCYLILSDLMGLSE